MLSYSDVKVLDANGKLKKIIKATKLSKEKWKIINENQVYNLPITDYISGRTTIGKGDYIAQGDPY
jgi:hypothetical protein